MKEKIKELIISIISDYEELSLTAMNNNTLYKELCQGDLAWEVNDLEGNPLNIVFAYGLNIDCITSYYELCKDEIIKVVPTEQWSVIHDGGEIYDLPIATSMKQYKTVHWSPRIIKKGANFKTATHNNKFVL